jgi:hypothetical protein
VKRILLVLSVALVMAALLVGTAGSVFAQGVGPVEAYEHAAPPGPPGPSPPLAFGGTVPEAGFNACLALMWVQALLLSVRRITYSSFVI